MVSQERLMILESSLWRISLFVGREVWRLVTGDVVVMLRTRGEGVQI